jgi:hypothetical protein
MDDFPEFALASTCGHWGDADGITFDGLCINCAPDDETEDPWFDPDGPHEELMVS